MAIRVTLECGHSSMLRSRTTPQGYTHDWEVFVRGVDNADISQYVEKVVFYLHETFPKPKRILKEPPYIVKESGYAGFVIPIDIYLKNKDEPKKIQITYDLILLPSGPAFNDVRHHEVFTNPSEEFRKKLLKGGGVSVSNSEDSGEKGEFKMVPPMVSKPKLSGTEVKKHRMTEVRTSNSFADLFGNPMTLPAKVSPESKRPQPDKVVSSKSVTEKTEKLDKSLKGKHSPHKDKKRDKSADERKEKKDKVLTKEKEKTKEKSKRPPSPGKDEFYAGAKKASILSPPKKQLAPPSSSSVQKSPSPKPKDRDHKKIHADREKDKVKDSFKVPDEDRKFDRKKKKHKDDKSKERKEKEKEREHEKLKDSAKKSEKKTVKPEKHEKSEKEKPAESKVSKDERKSPKHQKEKDKIRTEKSERPEGGEKSRDSRSDKEKQKHKHKRKDKKERSDESLDKEKQEKLKSSGEKKSSYSSPTVNPLSTLLAEMPERDSSDSTHSVDEDSIPHSKMFLMPKSSSEQVSTAAPNTETSKSVSPRPPETKTENDERVKRDKTKSSRGEERDGKRRKRKVENSHEEHGIKRSKDRENSVSPSVEPVSSSQSPISIDIDSSYNFKETATSSNQVNGVIAESEQVAPDSTNNAFIEPDIEGSQVFSEDYVSQLKDLQHKIMTLQDNQELQRVVQVIAETGQYEITKKTFDFDLCALDRRTVLRLQQFFSTS